MGQKTNASIFRLGLKNSEWNIKYIEKNPEESSIFLYKNIEIQNYLDNTFKLYNLFIHSCKIEHTQTTTNIQIAYYESDSYLTNLRKLSNFKTSKQLISFLTKDILAVSLNLYLKKEKITIKTQNLNKKFEVELQQQQTYLLEYKKVMRHFRGFLKTPAQKDFVKLLFISVFEKNSARLISEAISLYINKNKKKHNYLLFVLKRTLTVLINLNFSKIKGIKIVIAGRFNGAPRAKQRNLQIGAIPLQSFNENINYYNSTSYTPNGTFGVKVWVCNKIKTYVFTT